MAGVEERGKAARARARPAGDHHFFPYLGLAVAVIALARAPLGLAQTPAAPSPGGGTQAGPAAAGTGGTPAPGTGETAAPGAATFGPPGAAAPGAAERGPAWTFIPSVALDEALTDNVFSTATQRRADLITTLAPDFFATGASARLKGVFDYSPQLIKYADNTSQDQIQENLFGNGTLTAVPDLFFVDASASISNQSRLGGRGFDNTAQDPDLAEHPDHRLYRLALSALPFRRRRRRRAALHPRADRFQRQYRPGHRQPDRPESRRAVQRDAARGHLHL